MVWLLVPVVVYVVVVCVAGFQVELSRGCGESPPSSSSGSHDHPAAVSRPADTPARSPGVSASFSVGSPRWGSRGGPTEPFPRYEECR